MITEKDFRAWYREPFVWMLIAFPLAAVIGGIVTIILAIQSDDGLVVDDYYKKGLEINRTLERDRRAIADGLEAHLQYARGDEQVRLILRAGTGFTFPEKLSVSFLNASQSGLDQQLSLTKQGTNSYLGSNPELPRGKWHVLIEADDWRLLNVLTVP